MAKEAVRKVALRLLKDPTSATIDDIRKVVRGWFLQTEGKLPQ